MIGVGSVTCCLAIIKHYEPYELLPIGIGAILINLLVHAMGPNVTGVIGSAIVAAASSR